MADPTARVGYLSGLLKYGVWRRAHVLVYFYMSYEIRFIL